MWFVEKAQLVMDSGNLAFFGSLGFWRRCAWLIGARELFFVLIKILNSARANSALFDYTRPNHIDTPCCRDQSRPISRRNFRYSYETEKTRL